MDQGEGWTANHLDEEISALAVGKGEHTMWLDDKSDRPTEGRSRKDSPERPVFSLFARNGLDTVSIT